MRSCCRKLELGDPLWICAPDPRVARLLDSGPLSLYANWNERFTAVSPTIHKTRALANNVAKSE